MTSSEMDGSKSSVGDSDGDRIMVTPEMIEVGLKVHSNWYPWDTSRSLHDEAILLEEIFHAMLSRRHQPHPL